MSLLARMQMNRHKRHAWWRALEASGVAVSMLVAGVAAAPAMADSTQSPAMFSPNALPKPGVIVTAFQNNWKSIALECTKTYGPMGVKYVQVSPPNEHIMGKAWWTSYQPVSYELNSKLGTEAEFKQMVTTCKAAGVGIIADAVINHMSGWDNKDTKGVGGSAYNAAEKSFPVAGYTKDDFHPYDQNITNFSDAEMVWTRRLCGLLDLDTSKPHVQETIGNYFAHLLKLGVAGFRVDAVKHMAPQDVLGIKQAASKASGIAMDNIWWMQETIGAVGENPKFQPDKYVKTGQVDEFQYAHRLRNYFYGSISDLSHITDGLIPNDKAAIFVTNWDTERDSASQVLTYKDGARYEMANAFMLAYPYGVPNIFSGYKFKLRDEGVPGVTDSTVPDTVCAKDSVWQCTQRLTSIRGMVGFYNAVQGTKVTKWHDDDDNNVAFSRENKGFLALNNNDDPQKVSYTTDLPDGEYCNVYTSDQCQQTVNVSGGKVETTIPAHSAIALHAGAAKHVRSTIKTKIIWVFAAVAICCAVVVFYRTSRGHKAVKSTN